METNQEKSPEKEINNKSKNVIKFIQQYNKSNFEITKPKKAIHSSHTKSNKAIDVKNKKMDKIYVENYGSKYSNNKTNLLIKLKDNFNSKTIKNRDKVESPTANGICNL